MSAVTVSSWRVASGFDACPGRAPLPTPSSAASNSSSGSNQRRRQPTERPQDHLHQLQAVLLGGGLRLRLRAPHLVGPRRVHDLAHRGRAGRGRGGRLRWHPDQENALEVEMCAAQEPLAGVPRPPSAAKRGLHARSTQAPCLGAVPTPAAPAPAPPTGFPSSPAPVRPCAPSSPAPWPPPWPPRRRTSGRPPGRAPRAARAQCRRRCGAPGRAHPGRCPCPARRWAGWTTAGQDGGGAGGTGRGSWAQGRAGQSMHHCRDGVGVSPRFVI